MGAVFAAAVDAGDLLGFLELAVAVAIGDAEEVSSALVEPEGIEGPDEALGGGNGRGHFLDPTFGPSALSLTSMR